MKAILFGLAVLFSLGFASAEKQPPQWLPFTSKGIKYAIKDKSCRACIDKIGEGQYSSICYGQGADEGSIYCCNAAPPDPPLSNSP